MMRGYYGMFTTTDDDLSRNLFWRRPSSSRRRFIFFSEWAAIRRLTINHSWCSYAVVRLLHICFPIHCFLFAIFLFPIPETSVNCEVRHLEHVRQTMEGIILSVVLVVHVSSGGIWLAHLLGGERHTSSETFYDYISYIWYLNLSLYSRIMGNETLQIFSQFNSNHFRRFFKLV